VVTGSITGWLGGLSFGWLVVTVFVATFLVAAGVYWVVLRLAVGKRRDAFKAFSPGMLPPMGLLFGLIVGFLAAQVWSDAGDARAAVNREASALRSSVLLANAFPGRPEARINALIARQIQDEVEEEWPAMADRRATLTVIPVPIAEALLLATRLTPRTPGQTIAQERLVDSLQAAFDARRQRIIISESSVNWVKWTGVILVALLTLIAIAFVHCDNRLTAALALGLFSIAVAVSLLLIAAQQHPFSGQFAVGPDALVQVAPTP